MGAEPTQMVVETSQCTVTQNQGETLHFLEAFYNLGNSQVLVL